MATADYAKNELRKHLLRTGSFTKPAALYIALLTDATTEVTGGSYARKQCDPGDANWSAEATAGVSKNVSRLDFTTATAAWGTVTHFALYDAASAGNQIGVWALSSSVIVSIGDTPFFAIGSLEVSIT